VCVFWRLRIKRIRFLLEDVVLPLPVFVERVYKHFTSSSSRRVSKTGKSVVIRAHVSSTHPHCVVLVYECV